MEQEAVEESVLQDVFSDLKLDKTRSYLLLADFKTSLLKHKPKCLLEYYPDEKSLTECCEILFTNMIEASAADDAE